jgi:hypothetical protein
MLCAAAPDDRPLLETQPAVEDDILMTTQELADRWRLDPGSLANLRTRGEGPPFLKLENGSVRYKVRDVLDAETIGARGFSWDRLETALRSYPGMLSSDVDKLLVHLKKEMRG